MATCTSGTNGDIPRFLANGDRPATVVRRSGFDPLCARMERGEEEANECRRVASQLTNSADVKARRLTTSDRRKFPSGKFRSARDLEGAKRIKPRAACRQ